MPLKSSTLNHSSGAYEVTLEGSGTFMHLIFDPEGRLHCEDGPAYTHINQNGRDEIHTKMRYIHGKRHGSTTVDKTKQITTDDREVIVTTTHTRKWYTDGQLDDFDTGCGILPASTEITTRTEPVLSVAGVRKVVRTITTTEVGHYREGVLHRTQGPAHIKTELNEARTTYTSGEKCADSRFFFKGERSCFRDGKPHSTPDHASREELCIYTKQLVEYRKWPFDEKAYNTFTSKESLHRQADRAFRGGESLNRYHTLFDEGRCPEFGQRMELALTYLNPAGQLHRDGDTPALRKASFQPYRKERIHKTTKAYYVNGKLARKSGPVKLESLRNFVGEAVAKETITRQYKRPAGYTWVRAREPIALVEVVRMDEDGRPHNLVGPAKFFYYKEPGFDVHTLDWGRDPEKTAGACEKLQLNSFHVYKFRGFDLVYLHHLRAQAALERLKNLAERIAARRIARFTIPKFFPERAAPPKQPVNGHRTIQYSATVTYELNFVDGRLRDTNPTPGANHACVKYVDGKPRAYWRFWDGCLRSAIAFADFMPIDVERKIVRYIRPDRGQLHGLAIWPNSIGVTHLRWYIYGMEVTRDQYMQWRALCGRHRLKDLYVTTNKDRLLEWLLKPFYDPRYSAALMVCCRKYNELLPEDQRLTFKEFKAAINT